jgi:RNA polymerase sigma-70 factor (ECF subfamily)
MAEDARPLLMDYLAKHYGSLKLRLTQLLGNGDLAGDALQDTWLRVQSKAPEEDDPIQSPTGYLVRVAVNIAMDIQRRQSRTLPYDAVSALLEVSDPSPGPAQTAEGRSDLEAALKLMKRLPPRRREVLMMVRVEGLQQKDVARRLGVSLRTVEHELKRAHDYLDAHLNRDHEK